MMVENVEKGPQSGNEAADEDSNASGNEPENFDADSFKQDGVKNVEAVTAVWSKKALWFTFVM